MRALFGVIEFLAWCFAIWLFVGLIGTLRWLAPGADPGPQAWMVVSLKLAGLIVFVGVWVLTVRRVERSETSGALT